VRPLLAIAVAFLALPGLGAAPLSNYDGWKDLHWGMGKEKILKLYASARFTPGRQPRSTDVDLGEMALPGGKYSVNAVILDEKGLASLRISTLGRKEMPKRHEVAAMVGELRNELIMKYGPPSSKDDNSLTWRLERVRIILGWSMDAGILILTFRNPATM
jgi:hypothetical protein